MSNDFFENFAQPGLTPRAQGLSVVTPTTYKSTSTKDMREQRSLINVSKSELGFYVVSISVSLSFLPNTFCNLKNTSEINKMLKRMTDFTDFNCSNIVSDKY